jgi:uncharacterized protein
MRFGDEWADRAHHGGSHMEVPHDAALLRVFISVNDRYGSEPLHSAIITKAREQHLAGATVLRGTIGFGLSGHLHKLSHFPLTLRIPLIIEIVDSEEKIDGFLPFLDEMMESGLVTIEKAKVLQYGRHRARLVERIRNYVGRKLGTTSLEAHE